MKLFRIFIILIILFSCKLNDSEAGLSKINNIKIAVETNIKDNAKIKSINKQELLDELYLSIKSRLPLISIDKKSEYTLLLECYVGPYAISVGNIIYEAYSLTLILQSTNNYYDDISPYQKIYWQQGIQSNPSDVTLNNSTIKEEIKSLIDNLAKNWYEDQDNEKLKLPR